MNERDDLLAMVASLYYKLNQGQGEIAQRLGVSTSKVSRLIKEAWERGIIDVQIRMPIPRDFALENELVSRFGLRDAMVLAGTPDAGEVVDEPARAARAELVAAAFLDLCRASDALRARGARVDAFPQDTRGQRGERAVRAASVLRETLSPDEVELLGAARLVSLR